MLKYGRKLKRYLQDNDIEQMQFARDLGIHVVTVNNSWIKKSRKPQFDNALKINLYTRGVISLEELGYE